MKNIPKNLFCFLFKDVYSDISNIRSYRSNKPIIIIEFIDNRFSNQKYYLSKLIRYQRRYIRNFESIEYYGLTLENKEFGLFINTTRCVTKFYGSCVLIELIHKDFDNLSYQPAIYVETGDFLKLLSNCGGCIEYGVIPGNYKIGLYSFGEYSKYDIINEKNLTVRDRLSILVGESLSNRSNRKTTKLLPGHLYCFNNRQIFLCIGKIHNINVIKDSHTSRDTVFSIMITNLADLVNPRIRKELVEEGYLVIPLNYVTNCLLDFVMNKLCGKTIDNYLLIHELFKFSLKFEKSSLNSLFGIYSKKELLPAADMGKFINIVENTTDLVSSLKDIVNNILPDIENDLVNLYGRIAFSDVLLSSDLDISKKYKEKFFDSIIFHNKALFSCLKSDWDSIKSTILNEDVVYPTNSSYLFKISIQLLRSLINGDLETYGIKKLNEEDLDNLLKKIMKSC